MSAASEQFWSELPLGRDVALLQRDAHGLAAFNKPAGVLSHPYMMSVLSYAGTTSPIHRGVFLARTVLGNTLKPPQEAIAPLAPDQHPDLTTRERVTLQTKAVACQTCHTMINPLGFALEEFDAIGRYRATEVLGGITKPVDPSGSYLPREGPEAAFGNSLPTSPRAATPRRPSCRACFTLS